MDCICYITLLVFVTSLVRPFPVNLWWISFTLVATPGFVEPYQVTSLAPQKVSVMRLKEGAR